MADVESYRHESSGRSNLPTEQTAAYMDDGDKEPQRYAPPIRSRSGPVLAWDRGRGLDDIAVDAAPLYVTEKINPAAFIEQLQSKEPAPLFGDFNNLPPDADYRWYEYEGNWQNRLIRGDSVRVMASLIAKEGMAGKVQMIYMDPPYGIGFKSNLQIATKNRNTPANKNALPADPEFVQTFRDTYENGLHSYLDNLYRNFVYAREMLSDSGSIFFQIGSENVNRTALVLDEVFGAENRVAQITFNKGGMRTPRMLSEVSDYILWYAKDKTAAKFHQLYEQLTQTEMIDFFSSYAMVEFPDGTTRKLSDEEKQNPDLLGSSARLFRRMPLSSQGRSETGRSDPFVWNGVTFHIPQHMHWPVSHQGLERLAERGRLISADGATLAWKRYEDETPGRTINDLWANQMSPSDLHYVVETAPSVVERCMLMSTDPGDLVLDITCGGGTTAYVAEQWGRRWITADTSGVAIAITRQRLLSGFYKYHLLQNSIEGAMQELVFSIDSGIPVNHNNLHDDPCDPTAGFVYERVPRVSAAILAYDRQVDPILLVNRPISKRGVVRVSSPFTVESHSPWRYLPPAEAVDASGQQLDTRQRIIDAVAVSGIAASSSGRLRVEDVEDWGEAGRVTHSCTTIDDEGGRIRTAIAAAPDDQTAGMEFINIAADEAAARGLRRLIVIAFAFDPSAYDGAEQRGRLQVLKAQANRDFQIPGLENAPTDHAFVMIGQPEVKVADEGEGRISVEVLGYDTYNPATGNVERGEATDIDCWMIDTQYDGRSFFARRIHLPNSGGDKRLGRLRERLGRRVDGDLWAAMQSTKSAPFPRPAGGHARIAVRIITSTDVEMTVEIDVAADPGG